MFKRGERRQFDIRKIVTNYMKKNPNRFSSSAANQTPASDSVIS